MLCCNINFLIRNTFCSKIMTTNIIGPVNTGFYGLTQPDIIPPSQNVSKDILPYPSVLEKDNDTIFYEKIKSQWWDEDGSMRCLHSLNKVRIPFIRDGLLYTLPELSIQKQTPFPLRNTKILGIGCGGGILTEPLSILGAHVVGLDPCSILVALAKDHASSMPNLEYINEDIMEFCDKNHEVFDGVAVSEVIEHIKDKEHFIHCCIKTLKPGGSLFITNLSWLRGITENILKVVPPGAHPLEKFITPNDMSRLLDKYNCKRKIIRGLLYIFVSNEWHWTGNTSLSYAVHAIKKGKE